MRFNKLDLNQLVVLDALLNETQRHKSRPAAIPEPVCDEFRNGPATRIFR